MKLLALASVLSTIIICPPSEARSIRAEQHEVLHNVQINGEIAPRHVALLNMNFIHREIEVQIVNDICGQFADLPAGTIRCMAVAMPVATIRVPMNKAFNDGCGSAVYQGAEENRPADGNYEEITVTDNSRRTCENVIESLIVVDAKTITARSRTETNYHLTK